MGAAAIIEFHDKHLVDAVLGPECSHGRHNGIIALHQ